MEQINFENFKTLISEEEIKTRITKMAHEIDRDYKGEDVILISILKGASVFTINLMLNMSTPSKIKFMKVSSYQGTKSSGALNIDLNLGTDIKDKNVIICEDIVDTGYTLSYLKDYLLDKKPKSLKIAVLLDKWECRKKEVDVDYTGFKIEDKFIIGYGLDYNDVGRNLPYIGYVIDDKKQILTKS